MSEATGTLPRLAVIGTGRMGQAISGIASERGWPVVATIARGPVGAATITRDSLAGADVALEFTAPEAAASNAIACARAGVPVVVGTTGWYDELPAVEREVRASGGSLLYAPNFSLGVNMFLHLAEVAAALAAHDSGLDLHIVETHHTAKKDAPSGTALELGRRASAALQREVPVTSVRVGSVPGTHELLIDGTYEQLVIRHEARDRRVFAEGALAAARWLAARGESGIYTMRDVLADPIATREAP